MHVQITGTGLTKDRKTVAALSDQSSEIDLLPFSDIWNVFIYKREICI